MSLRSVLVCTALALAPLCLARDRERTYDLKHVDWSVSFDESKGEVFGDVTNTVAPFADTSDLTFDCGKLTVRRVTVNNKPATFDLKGETLTVHLASPAKAGVDVDVRITYYGVPQAGMYFIPASRAYPSASGMVYTQGEAEDNRYWLPTYDFPNDKATSSGHITVKPGQIALSIGDLESVTKTADSWTYNWRMRQPHSTYLIAFMAGDYVTQHENWDGLDVFYAVPKGLEELGKNSFAGTADMVKFYSDLTGFRYPYAKFSQGVVSDYMFGGMENITMVTQTIGTLHSPLDDAFDSSEGLVLHELAHQWFGDTVTCRDWAHIWLNEGWATFLPHFYARYKHGEDAYDIARYGTLQGAYRAARSSSRPVVTEDYEIPMDNFGGNSYGGGAARMFMLMDLLGEKVFWQGVHKYLETYKYDNATTEKFFQVMSQMSGRDLDQFRKQWFYTAGAPQVSAKNDGSELTITQSPSTFSYDLPVGVFKDGSWRMVDVPVSGETTKADLGDVDGAAVMLDPGCRLMIGFGDEPPLTKEQIAAMFKAAPNAATKVRLSQAMRGWTSDEKQAIYNSETSVDVKVSLFSIFGADDALFLIGESHSSNERIAAEAIEQMRGDASNPDVQARLREVWEKNPSPTLRAHAVRALAFATQDGSLAEKAWSMPSVDESFRKFALDYWARYDKARARKECLAQLMNPIDEEVRVAAIQHLGSLKDEEGSHAAYDALLRVLDEPSFGALRTAIGAIASYGNKDAVQKLEPLTHHSLFMIRRAAQGAIDGLNKQ